MSDKELNKIIADNILRLLASSGKSQQELADYLNVSHTAVTSWVKGIKTPRMSKIDKICTFFSVDRSALFNSPEDITRDKLYPSDFELDLLLAYRKADDITREMVHRALGISENDQVRKNYVS